MYQSLLFTHSWLRWIILLLILVVIIKSLIGTFSDSTYKKSDNILAASMVGTLHLQLLLGFILYFVLSPIVGGAFSDFGAAMKDASIRYWAAEHISIMIFAAILAQVGRSKAKKALEDRRKFKIQLIYFTVSLLLILSRIPFTDSERLFR